ncbi:hypothetical protein ACROYT_G031072 [Oculina patagonica]
MVTEFTNAVEEPESGSDTELVACLEAVERKEKVEKAVRFATLNSDELTAIVSNAQAKETKRNTKWGVKIFEEWCCQRGIKRNVLQMSNEELDESLRRFYAEARSQTGQEYSRPSLLGFRNSIERHIIANSDRSLKITGNPVFARSNKMLEAKLKALRREGKEKVQHKAVIESQDLIKINKSPIMSPNTPEGLFRKVCFFARCTGAEEVAKASDCSVEIASSLKKMQLVSSM